MEKKKTRERSADMGWPGWFARKRSAGSTVRTQDPAVDRHARA